MAALNSWQRIDRVIYGRPFGDGKDGAYSNASAPSIKYKTCTGTANSTTLTADTDASPFVVGDVLLIHQTQSGTPGQWEINRVSAVGSDEYTMQVALKYTYASASQAIVIPRYTSCTVESGTWVPTAWGGTVGGILPIAVNGTLTVTGTVSAKGSDGGTGRSHGVGGGDGYGFKGGNRAYTTPIQTAWQGDSTSGAGGQSRNANGSGGGGGGQASGGGSGGGGGHAASGSNATGGEWGTGGGTSGSETLATMTFGGGGGGGSVAPIADPGGGGAGGGIIIFFAKTIAEITGAITVNGGNGGTGGTATGGGGGAGGSVLLVCNTANLGSNKVTATGGTKGTDAGNGSVGRIAVYHSGTVDPTSDTNPDYNDNTDISLVETDASFLMNFI